MEKWSYATSNGEYMELFVGFITIVQEVNLHFQNSLIYSQILPLTKVGHKLAQCGFRICNVASEYFKETICQETYS
jgi:hypothetical protein